MGFALKTCVVGSRKGDQDPLVFLMLLVLLSGWYVFKEEASHPKFAIYLVQLDPFLIATLGTSGAQGKSQYSGWGHHGVLTTGVLGVELWAWLQHLPHSQSCSSLISKMNRPFWAIRVESVIRG